MYGQIYALAAQLLYKLLEPDQLLCQLVLVRFCQLCPCTDSSINSPVLPFWKESFIPAHETCQFFICHDPQPHLDGVHTVFGQVTDNLGAVRAMRNGDVMAKVEITEE